MRIVAMAAFAAMCMAGMANAADVDDDDFVDRKGAPKMCTVQVMAKVPCAQIGRAVDKSYVEPVHAKERCVTACLSDSAWRLSHSKRWWADSVDHVHKTPRFDTQCGKVCRPCGFPKMGHKSKDTGEWTVFRFDC